ncbi:MAG: hypothetical protein ACR2FU_03715 [Streptosporangiaceae bacterium]
MDNRNDAQDIPATRTSMPARTLGSNGLEVSAIGFGCMGMSQSHGPNPGSREEMIGCCARPSNGA